jgi:hypothetical protein
MVMKAKERHGDFFVFAEAALGLMPEIPNWIREDNPAFRAFLSHLHVSLVLSLLSEIRRHDTQSLIMVRQAAEAAQLAVYALKEKPTNWGTRRSLDRAREEAYRWLDAHYPSTATLSIIG